MVAPEPTPLSEQELQRYTRHILLKEIGGAGQQKLKRAKILMVGAGGLGAPCLFYLAAAGIGTIGIVDDDVVALDNLQRQILYQMSDLNQAKATSAQRHLLALNPDIEIIAHPTRLTKENALALFEKYDLIADGTDNFETRFLINDACHFATKPLVSGAVGQFDGQLASFRSFETDENGTPNPSWRCLVGDRSTPTADCDQGVMGALCGIIGTMQALEIIKQITQVGDTLINRVLIYDGLSGKSRIIRLRWDKNNPLNGEAPRIFKAQFC